MDANPVGGPDRRLLIYRFCLEICIGFNRKMTLFTPIFGPFHCTRHTKPHKHMDANPVGGPDRRYGPWGRFYQKRARGGSK